MAARSRIGELLVKARVIDEMQLRSAQARQDQWGGRIPKIIAEMRLATDDAIVAAISKSTGAPVTHLGMQHHDPAALARIDLRTAEELGVFPIELKDKGKTLVVAFADPTDLETIDAFGRVARARVQITIASEREIQHA